MHINRMTLLRDRENEHYEVITETATVLLEQYSKGHLEEELPDQLKIVRFASTTTTLCVLTCIECP